MRKMYDTNSGLALDVRWQPGTHAINYSGMFGTDTTNPEASEWDTGGALGYMQVKVPPKGDKLMMKPYIQNNIGVLVNFGKKIENVGLKFDTSDSGVLTADGCRAYVGLKTTSEEGEKRAIAIDSNGKTLVCTGGGTEIISSRAELLDLSSFLWQLADYWRAIGFEMDEDGYIHIPAYAVAPAATGCYIKKEYLPKEMWVRMDMPYIYQLPITPLFGN